MLRPSKWFGWSRSPDAPRSNPHSLEQLKLLYNFLEKNQTVSEHNRTVLVETLRQIAEILIWGDQNDSTVFDFFLEKNMLCFFLRIMKQKCGGFVCTQLLQTLNILFENIKNETSLYYLLSNNHVNSIIVHKFDFDDEEVMAYYISFLKTLSLKLNNHTVHFFFNEHTADFPLYTEAIKFFNHSEKMVRIAVRTLTLNVFRVRENAMLRFIRDCTAAPYFSNLSWFIGKHVLDIESSLSSYIAFRNSNLSSSSNSGHNLIIRLEDLVAEHLDHLHYLNDILRLNIDDLNSVLSDNLLLRLIIPLYIHSFLSIVSNSYLPLKSEEPPTTTTSHHAKDDSATQSETRFIQTAQNSSLSTSVALFLLTQAYIIFSYGPLLNTLVEFLLKSGKTDIELNARRCEFTQPNKSLEAAIEQAISSSSNFGNSDVSESGSFHSSLSVKIPMVLDENLNESSTILKRFENVGQPTKSATSNLPQQNALCSDKASPTHHTELFVEAIVQKNNCDLKNPELKLNETNVQLGNDLVEKQCCSEIVVDWANRPFLVVLLATLNANISAISVGSEATSLEGSYVAANHLQTNKSLADVKDSANNQSNNNCDQLLDNRSNEKTLLSKLRQSSQVSESIPEVSSADDRIVLFTLSLISSILSNKEINTIHYRGVFIPNPDESSLVESKSFCSELINSLLLIIRQCCTQNYSITLVTFELAVYLFKKIVFYYRSLERSSNASPEHQSPTKQWTSKIFLSDHQLALLEQANEDASHLMRQYFRSTEESVFLEIFEQEAEIAATAAAASLADETTSSVNNDGTKSNRSSLSSSPLNIWSYNLNLNLEKLFMDSTLLLPPKEISPGVSDSNFYLRLPATDYEKTRYAVKTFFVLRRLSFEVRSADSTNIIYEKPFDFSNLLADSSSTSNISLDQFLDLENSDLIACSVKFYYPLNQNRTTFISNRTNRSNHYSNSSSRSESPALTTGRKKLFMVITSDLVILIEPDNKRYGCGIIRFLARLQDLEILPNSYAVTQFTSPPIPEKEKDSGTLYVYFRRHQLSNSMNDSGSSSSSSSSSFRRPTPLSSSHSIILGFAFDDRIRYFAAMRHLSKAQSKVRDRKLSAIVRLIDLNSVSDNSSSVCGGQQSFQHYAANRLKLSDYTDSTLKKKAISNHHSARKFAVPGGAVLSMNANSSADTGPLPSGINKFDIAVKKRYPIATTTASLSTGKNRHNAGATSASPSSVSSKTPDSSDNRTKNRNKKLKYPLGNVIQATSADQNAIPLKDLSPKTIRRNNNNDTSNVTNAQLEQSQFTKSEQSCAELGNTEINQSNSSSNNNNNNNRVQDLYNDDHKSAT